MSHSRTTITRAFRSIYHPRIALANTYTRSHTALTRSPIIATLSRKGPAITSLTTSRSIHESRNSGMASDEDYMSFLNKANEDVSGGGGGQATTQGSKAQFKAVDSGAKVPDQIQKVIKDAFYVSDADEPFQGVSLKYSGDNGLPDEVEFAKLINHWDPEKADIEIQDPLDWDSKGQYTKILEAVREASQGNDVRVYRVTKDSTRAEYWLVSNADGRIVGVKALGVES